MTSQPLSILLVDDDKKLLVIFKWSIESLRPDWKIHTVDSGPAAMKEMEARGYDVLVTDISMGGIDGIDVLRWTQRVFPRIHRIVVSGMIDGRTLVEVNALAHVHLIKPVMAETVVERIEGLAQGKPGAAHAEEKIGRLKNMNQQCRVLIVDDNPGMNSALKYELADQPYEVITALSADEAMPVMKQLLPEVVVSDFQMPGMLGTQLLMHASIIIPHGGRILITGSPSLNMAVDAINLGAVSRLFIKPFSPALLIRAISLEMARIETARLIDRILARSHEPATPGVAPPNDYRPHDVQEILKRLRRAADAIG